MSDSVNRINQLIDRYCRAWSVASSDHRRQILAEIWSDNATYTDPTVHTTGLEQLVAHIDTVVTKRPGAMVIRTSSVDVHHSIARFAWQVVEADGSTRPESLDIAELTTNTKIARIIGFFGPVTRANL